MNAAKLHGTALHHAAKVENVQLIELLVEFGGNVLAKDSLGKKPVHYSTPGSSSALSLDFYESKFHTQTEDAPYTVTLILILIDF